jgi:hypothetical protein
LDFVAAGLDFIAAGLDFAAEVLESRRRCGNLDKLSIAIHVTSIRHPYGW